VNLLKQGLPVFVLVFHQLSSKTGQSLHIVCRLINLTGKVPDQLEICVASNYRRFVYLTIILVGTTLTGRSAFAQASATSKITTTMEPAIAITNTAALQFGLIVSGTGGTVTVSTAGARTATGPRILTNASFPVTAAAFTVTGGDSLAYTITLPTTVTLTGPGSSTMSVGTFVSNPVSPGTLSATGTSTLSVGATLTVGTNQTAGDYTGTFTVTVNYQ